MVDHEANTEVHYRVPGDPEPPKEPTDRLLVGCTIATIVVIVGIVIGTVVILTHRHVAHIVVPPTTTQIVVTAATTTVQVPVPTTTQASAPSFPIGDENPHDASAAQCQASMQIGPHSDCAVALHVERDLERGRWNPPGSDTVKDGSQSITFACSQIGNDTSVASQAPVYGCKSGDRQDWFVFSFT